MKVRAVLAGVLAALALAALSPTAHQRAPSPVAQRDEAASEEALRGLEKALTRHCSYASNGFLRRFDARDFRGCRVTYELTPQVPPGHTGYVPAAERTTVELSSLDAALVEVRPGRRGTTVSIAARDAARVIERRLGEGPHGFGEAARLGTAYLYVPNRGAAEAVRAALVRAIESCRKQGVGPEGGARTAPLPLPFPLLNRRGAPRAVGGGS